MHMLEERKSEGSDELTLARDLSANLVTEGNRPPGIGTITISPRHHH